MKENIRKKTYKILKIGIYIVILLILLYIFINGTKSFKFSKYEAFIVISESMQPEINNGDILIIKKVNQDDIKVGDIITFERKNEYITHRVIEIKQEGANKKFITKGDNNLIPDQDEISIDDVMGVKIGKVPLIGLLIIKIPEQKYIIIILSILFLLYKRAKNIDNREKERRRKKKIKEEKVNED